MDKELTAPGGKMRTPPTGGAWVDPSGYCISAKGTSSAYREHNVSQNDKKKIPFPFSRGIGGRNKLYPIGLLPVGLPVVVGVDGGSGRVVGSLQREGFILVTSSTLTGHGPI